MSAQAELLTQNTEAHSYRPPYKKWYQLPGTGFDVGKQIEQLQTDLNEGINNKSYSTILEDWSNKLRQDVYGFSLEYLRGNAFLPFKLAIRPYKNEHRLVPDRYGEKPVVDLIDPRERGGSVKKGVEKVEELLLNAPIGSIVVRTSPPGRTDLFVDTEQGKKEIVYHDTQTQIYEKSGITEIRSYTIRTTEDQMDLEKNEQLLKTLGASKVLFFFDKSLRERLAFVSGLNIFIHPHSQISVKDIVNQMSQITGNRAFGDVSFDKVLTDMNHFEELIQIDDLTLSYTNTFLNFAQNLLMEYHEEILLNQRIPLEVVNHLEEELGKMILELFMESKNIYDSENAQERNNMNLAYFRRLPNSNMALILARYPHGPEAYYQQALTELQTKPGCAGGGESDSSDLTQNQLSTAFGLRSMTLENPVDGKTKKKNECTGCHQEMNESLFHCPGCHKNFKPPVGNECKCGFTKEQAATQGMKVC